jgi:energy-coupling factor transporter ATP-binding protein EcfA2
MSETSNSTEVENFIFDQNIKAFLDRTTILYGVSGSGKSKIIIDLMYLLNPFIKQIIVICPTDLSNKTYSSGVVPVPLIHYSLNDNIIIKLWKRQEMFSSVYSRANNPNILERLFKKLQLGSVNKKLEVAESRKAQYIKEIHDQYVDKSIQDNKKKEIEDKFAELYVKAWKNEIHKHAAELANMDLDIEERFALKYRNFNPRMLVIFDDCTADFKRLKTKEAKEILEKFYFQGRWANLTMITAIHDDKKMDSSLRKNAYVSIFTTKEAATVFFGRGTMGYTKKMMQNVERVCDLVFVKEHKYQKLAYIRQEDKLYRCTATERAGFTFGGHSIKMYCDMIVADGTSIDTTNEFYDYFATPKPR